MVARIARTDEVFIGRDDGWVLPFYFSAVPHVHPEVRGTYRPFMPSQRAFVMERIRNARNSEESANLISRTLAAQIKTWDLQYVDDDGRAKPAPISRESMATMRNELWDKLSQLVISQAIASETDPLWGAEQKQHEEDDRFEALLTGKAQAEAAVESLEKN